MVARPNPNLVKVFTKKRTMAGWRSLPAMVRFFV
jgi:hypothetical protein